jgi:hypothetical protein
MIKLFKRKPKTPKCSCGQEARGYMYGAPLCLNCMLIGRQYINQVINAVKEDNWRADDKREVAEIEKRYTKGLFVKGSG